MFVQMSDLLEWQRSCGLGQQVSISTGGRGAATVARQAVGAGVGRGPVPLSPFQQEQARRRRDLYLSPIERQRREEAERREREEKIRHALAHAKAQHGTNVVETETSRAARGVPRDPGLVATQDGQVDELRKRGVTVRMTPGAEVAAWGSTWGGTRTRTPAPTPTPAPAPQPPPPTGPRPAPAFKPDYVTRFVNAPRPVETGRSSWETSNEWLRRHDPDGYERRKQAERAELEALQRVAERARPKPPPKPRAQKPDADWNDGPGPGRVEGADAANRRTGGSGFKPSKSWTDSFADAFREFFGLAPKGGAARVVPQRDREEA